jgi:hypothetical protein
MGVYTHMSLRIQREIQKKVIGWLEKSTLLQRLSKNPVAFLRSKNGLRECPRIDVLEQGFVI